MVPWPPAQKPYLLGPGTLGSLKNFKQNLFYHCLVIYSFKAPSAGGMGDHFHPDTLGNQGIIVLWTRTSVPCFLRYSKVNGGTFQASVIPWPITRICTPFLTTSCSSVVCTPGEFSVPVKTSPWPHFVVLIDFGRAWYFTCPHERVAISGEDIRNLTEIQCALFRDAF